MVRGQHFFFFLLHAKEARQTFLYVRLFSVYLLQCLAETYLRVHPDYRPAFYPLSLCRLFGVTGNCAACSKLIPAFEMVMRARDNVYHLDCFACQLCRQR